MKTGLKRWFLNLSLARKLTVLATATAAVSVLILCLLLGWSDTNRLRSHLVTDNEIFVDMFGASSTGALAFGDSTAAAETLRGVSVNRNITAAAILTREGKVLARYDRDGVIGPTPALLADPVAIREHRRWHAFIGARLVVSRPIVLNEEVIGTAYVELDLSELNDRLLTLWRSLALALVGTVVLAGAIGWRLQRVVSAPLLHLTGITRAVSRDRTYSIRAEKLSHDEVGELAEGFNEMLDNIQQRDVSLESHRRELEQTVNARTAELKANVERYRLLVESTHAVPWEIDGWTGTFSYISPQAMKLFGYENLALVGRLSMADLVHPDDRERVSEQLKALPRSSSAGLDLDYRVVTAYNRVIDVRSAVSSHIYRDGRIVLCGITLDVTRQKKLELELRQAQKLESVGRLAAGVAHEINTPVQFVSDSVHFVRDAMGDLAGLIQTYQQLQEAVAAGQATAAQAEQMRRAADTADLDYLLDNVPKALDRSLDGLNRVATIVRSMKEFAHPDQKEMAAINLNQAIQSTLTIARNEYKYVAEVETDLGEIPLVTCHGGDVNQVILNIIVNAAHAIEGVVKDSGAMGRIAIQTRLLDDAVVIRVSDTGAGIPEEIRDRIFDPFFTTKQVGKGTGQGLAICRSVILEKHGGDLTFESEVGKGTTFVIRLPIDGHRRTGAAA
jgi:PAS domain S-box-containing protein